MKEQSTGKTSMNRIMNKSVLYQKLGSRWYVFAEEDGETYFSALPEGMDPLETELEIYQVLEEKMAATKVKKKSSQKNNIAPNAPMD
ncbi:MAG: hypothetical protein HQK53_15605 [Oligoflexia bacterium]|nr:hypothetical protein [Oligoflexia bacterium]